MKICRKCNTEKENDSFYHHKKVCKSCYNENSRKYRIDNPDKIKNSRTLWETKNIERRRFTRRNQIRNKRIVDPLFALRSAITRSIRDSISKNGFTKTLSTKDILGCTFEEFKLYIESKFEPWMTWENRGKYNGEFNFGWDVDHIVPLSSAGTEDEIIKLNHYTNLQPLCGKYNREIKKDKLDNQRE